MKAALAALAATLGFGALALAPTANALPDPELGPGCDTLPTGSLIDQFGYRPICDYPVNADGSWTRKRTLWGESNRVCTRINTGLGSPRHCRDEDGPIHIYHQEEYVVQPDAVPPGEPGHLG